MQPFQSKSIRVGFIGLGDHADEQLLPALATIPNVELTVISSRNSEKLQTFANKFKPKFTSSNWEEVINPDLVDAIIVSASPELHYKVAKKCLKKGIHIFIEKPHAQNLAQLQELVKYNKKIAKLLWATILLFQKVLPSSNKLLVLTSNFSNPNFFQVVPKMSIITTKVCWNTGFLVC